MAGFKSPSQRKFLYAMDKDKQKGISPIGPTKSSPTTISTAWPSAQRTEPPAAYKLGNPSNTKFNPPVGSTIKPTSNPTIIGSSPSLPKAPRFAKTKKLFKK